LKAIAGIEEPDSGKIILDGKVLFDSEAKVNLPPQARKVGYLFQSYALFPNMNVLENILCGLQAKGLAEAEAKQKAQGLIEKFKLQGLENSYPRQLSGGQKQRVALARLLAAEPEVIILDEPFSALDYQTRLSVQNDIYSIIKSENKTAILVTHDISEAIAMSDRIIILTKRPGTIKKILSLEFQKDLTPLERRNSPLFNHYFKQLWEELQ
jgi:NitT/TauT family transport system ATP-binding protein